MFYSPAMDAQPDPEAAYRAARDRNNEAARRSRAKAKHMRAETEWLLGDGAGLSGPERLEATRFLADEPCTLTPATKEALRKHLTAKRARERDRIGALLKRLEELP